MTGLFVVEIVGTSHDARDFAVFVATDAAGHKLIVLVAGVTDQLAVTIVLVVLCIDLEIVRQVRRHALVLFENAFNFGDDRMNQRLIALVQETHHEVELDVVRRGGVPAPDLEDLAPNVVLVQAAVVGQLGLVFVAARQKSNNFKLES